MADQQRQRGGATHMQPETFSGTAKSGFVAADHRRLQTSGEVIVGGRGYQLMRYVFHPPRSCWHVGQYS